MEPACLGPKFWRTVCVVTYYETAQLFVHIAQPPATADTAVIPHASSFARSSLHSLQLGLPFISYNLCRALQSSESRHLSTAGIQVTYNESGSACRRLGRVNGWCPRTWRMRYRSQCPVLTAMQNCRCLFALACRILKCRYM